MPASLFGPDSRGQDAGPLVAVLRAMGGANSACCWTSKVEDLGVQEGHILSLGGSGLTNRPQDLKPESGRDAVLGCSSIGTVLRARNQRSKVVHALRQISKRMLDGGLCKEEVEALTRLDHPHICKLHDAWEDPMSLYMILDLCNGGNLTDLGSTQEQLSESVIAVLVEQMVSAVNHMHERGVVHSDLRPENWLFKETIGPTSALQDMDLKMIDFGLASKHSKQGSRSRMYDAAVLPAASSTIANPKVRGECSSPISDASSNSSRIGGLDFEPTLAHLFCKAPEQVCKPEQASSSEGQEKSERGPLEKADCWALGVITYFLLSGVPPFPLFCLPENDSGFRNARFVFMPTNLWRHVSSEAKNFIALCLHKDPGARPPAARLLKMPWMQQARGEVRVPGAELLTEGVRLPTSQAVLLALERMRRLQLVQRDAVIATAFRLPADELPALRKAFEQRDVSKLGFLPAQEFLHVLVNQFDVNCTDLAILVQESSLSDSCNIPYSIFVHDVQEFQQNTQDSIVWEVFSRLGGGNPNAQLPKKMLMKALDGGEYQRSIADYFPQLRVQQVCKELEKDAEGRLGVEEFRQVLQEARGPNLKSDRTRL